MYRYRPYLFPRKLFNDKTAKKNSVKGWRNIFTSLGGGLTGDFNWEGLKESYEVYFFGKKRGGGGGGLKPTSHPGSFVPEVSTSFFDLSFFISPHIRFSSLISPPPLLDSRSISPSNKKNTP